MTNVFLVKEPKNEKRVEIISFIVMIVGFFTLSTLGELGVISRYLHFFPEGLGDFIGVIWIVLVLIFIKKLRKTRDMELRFDQHQLAITDFSGDLEVEPTKYIDYTKIRLASIAKGKNSNEQILLLMIEGEKDRKFYIKANQKNEFYETMIAKDIIKQAEISNLKNLEQFQGLVRFIFKLFAIIFFVAVAIFIIFAIVASLLGLG